MFRVRNPEQNGELEREENHEFGHEERRAYASGRKTEKPIRRTLDNVSWNEKNGNFRGERGNKLEKRRNAQ